LLQLKLGSKTDLIAARTLLDYVIVLKLIMLLYLPSGKKT